MIKACVLTSRILYDLVNLASIFKTYADRCICRQKDFLPIHPTAGCFYWAKHTPHSNRSGNQRDLSSKAQRCMKVWLSWWERYLRKGYEDCQVGNSKSSCGFILMCTLLICALDLYCLLPCTAKWVTLWKEAAAPLMAKKTKMLVNAGKLR